MSAFDAPASGGDRPAGSGPMPVGEVVSQTLTRFQADMPGFLLGGLIPFAIQMMVATVGVFVGLFAVYGGMFVGMVPGMVLGDDDLTAVGMLFGLAAGTFGLVFGFAAILGAVLAPINASLHRAVWRALETGESLKIDAAFSTARQDLGRVVGFALVSSLLMLVGLSMCYLPAIVVGAALMFAGPAIYIHRLTIPDAIRRSVGHLSSNPGWHLGMFLVVMIATMVLAYIPLIGGLLAATIHPMLVLIAYRSEFPEPMIGPDGEVIVLA
ncbi:MAG: hypothetical protein ABMB14_29990, partial [Myxococcota bacterium]